MVRKRKAERRQHPLDTLRWVNPDTLRSNDYNPNHVFGPEMQLLKLSILENGWTMPIVVHADGEIIDGFHRWTLGRTDEDIREMSGNLVPVVTCEGTEADRMLATVRHNRARGQHGILKMGHIVRALEDAGLSEKEIETRLGMEDEERERLSDMRGSPAQAGKDSFGKGWVPVERE